MKYLCFLLLAMPLISKSQIYTQFAWLKDTTEFKSVKMKVIKADKKVLFEGHKESKITITKILGLSPQLVQISIKLGEYLQIENVVPKSFNYEVNFGNTLVSYTIRDGFKIIALVISFKSDTYEYENLSVSYTNNYKLDNNSVLIEVD